MLLRTQEVDTIDATHADAKEVQYRWHQVDESRKRRGASNRHARPPHEERHPKHLLIQEDAMGFLAVVAERLPVIAGDDDDRVLQQVAGCEVRGELRDLRVFVLNGGNVWIEMVFVVVRQVVGTMRVEEVNPGEERFRIMLAKPPCRLVDDVAGSASGRDSRAATCGACAVKIEPLLEAAAGCQHRRRDEGRRAQAMTAKGLRQRREFARQGRVGIVTDGQSGRINAGKE
jgi:hypothetical protein